MRARNFARRRINNGARESSSVPSFFFPPFNWRARIVMFDFASEMRIFFPLPARLSRALLAYYAMYANFYHTRKGVTSLSCVLHSDATQIHILFPSMNVRKAQYPTLAHT